MLEAGAPPRPSHFRKMGPSPRPTLQKAPEGCTVPEICSITGHSPNDANSILLKHYLGPDRRLAESAIEKLEMHRARTRTVNGPVNRSAEQPAKNDLTD